MSFKSSKDFYDSIPGKKCGAGVLFLDKEGKVLLVKPSYKEGWTLPGGVVEKNESPQWGAVREVSEEIGLSIDDPTLLCVTYKKNSGDRP